MNSCPGLYIYTYIYISIYIHICIYVSTRYTLWTFCLWALVGSLSGINVWMHIYIYIYLYTYTYIYVYLCIYIYLFFLSLYIHILYIWIDIYIRYIYTSYVWFWSKHENIDRSICDVFSHKSKTELSIRTWCVLSISLLSVELRWVGRWSWTLPRFDEQIPKNCRLRALSVRAPFSKEPVQGRALTKLQRKRVLTVILYVQGPRRGPPWFPGQG